MVAVIAIVVSQVPIFIYWKDAKFGTAVNVIILILCIFHTEAGVSKEW